MDQTSLAFDPQREWFVTEVKYGEDEDAEKDYFTFIVFPPGEFLMGSPEHEEGRWDAETLREVEIKHPFALCDREVTDAQYRRFLISRNGGEEDDSGTPDQPAVNLSWNDAVEYCRWLERFGVQFRLPTKEEWEYACRAGTITPFSHGSDEALLRNYARQGGKGATAEALSRTCGVLRPSLRGLFDIHGNVWEWCSNPHEESATPGVYRGGGWGFDSRHCRSAIRYWSSPDTRVDFLGFRVAAVLPGQASQEPEGSSAERKAEHAAASEPPNP